MNRNALVANLEQVLSSRNNDKQQEEAAAAAAANDDDDVESKPVILVTNGEGIHFCGLISLVNALLSDGRFDVQVCAPQFDKSVSAHSLTFGETVEVSSVDINGATAFQVSGTPADCVSLALSQALFSSSKPLLVLSGINRGLTSGQNMFYSGAIAAAREALIHGVPSLCISLDWKNDVSCDDDFKDAVQICLPLIYATITDIRNGTFPKSCFLNVHIPLSPSTNKGFRLTRQSLWRSSLSWRAISSYKHPSAMNFMASQQSLGIQLARLGRDASAAGAARRLHTNKMNVEIESVGVSGETQTRQTIRKHYRLEFLDKEKEKEEFLDKEKEDVDDDSDFKAIQNGFVAITPQALCPDLQTEVRLSVSNWLSSVLAGEQIEQ